MNRRLTKPELEQVIRSMIPSQDSEKHAKQELAELRANFAEWIYNNSEPVEADRT